MSGNGNVIASLLLRFLIVSSPPPLLPLSRAKNGLFLPLKSLGGGMIRSRVLLDDVSSPEVSHGVFGSAKFDSNLLDKDRLLHARFDRVNLLFTP